MKSEIEKHKAAQWQNFRMTIQETHDNKVLPEQEEITTVLHKYYREQFKAPLFDYSDAHEVQIDSECNGNIII